MNRILILMLACACLLCACGTAPEATEPTENLQIANPWKDYASLEEAEAASGLTFPLGDTVGGSYQADSYRVMNGELLEVTYRDGDYEVTVRMQAGEGQDISGVYEEFTETETFDEEGYTLINMPTKNGGLVQLVYKDGFSYSLYAPQHFAGDSNADFLSWLNE